jgi:signal transduction histidine kinase
MLRKNREERRRDDMPNEQGHIFVVDDSPRNRLKLSRFLQQQGHTVTEAEHGRQALEMLKDQSFDLMLLDIIMPEMDGYQVLGALKQQERLRDMPVIVISALEEMESVITCIEIGAEDYLPKPFDPVLLKARISACLEKKRLRDQEVEHHRMLAETNEKLEVANRNYMQMLGFVTHELKSPLAAIQSMIVIIVDGFVGEVPNTMRHHLLRIQRNCEELQDMVKNYLDLSRAERGELVAKKSTINFHKDVVKPCVEQTGALFRSRDVTLTVTSPEDLMVLADPELLRIALMNYLTNAAKYGVEHGQATLTVVEVQGVMTVSVWNEGAGFTAEEKALLFKKFSRLRNKHTSNKRGSGLGLFLIRRILEQHDGKVWAESEPDHWAKFCFNVPMNPD